MAFHNKLMSLEIIFINAAEVVLNWSHTDWSIFSSFIYTSSGCIALQWYMAVKMVSAGFLLPLLDFSLLEKK